MSQYAAVIEEERLAPHSADISERIVGILIETGKLSETDLERAIHASERIGQRLSLILDRLGLVSQQDWANAASVATGFDVLQRDALPEISPVDKNLTFEFLQRRSILPISVDEKAAHYAIVDPGDRSAVNALRMLYGEGLALSIAIERDIDAALERMRKAQESVWNDTGADLQDADRLEELANDAPTVRFVETMLSNAVERRATDLHFEPVEDGARLRLRIDGVLVEADAPLKALVSGIVSRLKIESALDIAERRIAQDGRMSLRIAGRKVDIRVATAPSVHGEAVTLRFLYSDASHAHFEALELPPNVERPYRAALAQPNGLILVTGPTGSGKTTTLHAALDAVNDDGRKIVTIEDPVEIRKKGLVQLEVAQGIGWTFAAALRSVLRHDPDVIMVGEIRDQETAELALRAALTGHLVLSTLHANRAVDAITRLEDIGVERAMLMATLRLASAQRLVRRLCDACARPVTLDEAAAQAGSLGTILRKATAKAGNREKFRAPVGCAQCHDGYRGRIAIHEILDAKEAERMLLGEPRKTSAGLGYDGLRRILMGHTTPEEVLRVAGPPEGW